jgi:TRAP-type C4-dicarboxylate transport system permease large subunit
MQASLGEVASGAVLWGVVLLSISVSILALSDAIREYVVVRRTHIQAKRLFSNGRVRIARFRRRMVFWYLAGFALLLLFTLLASYRNLVVDPPEAANVATLITTIRVLFLGLVVAFWLSMHAQREIRHELMEAADIKEGVQEAQHMQERTYEKVEAIDEKLDAEKTSLDIKEAKAELKEKGGASPEENGDG